MREPIRVLPAPALPGVSIIDAEWEEAPPDCMFDAYVIRVQHRGTIELQHRRESFRAAPGVYAVQPGEMLVHHAPPVDLPLTSHAVVIDRERFGALVEETGAVTGVPVFRTFMVTHRADDLRSAVDDLVTAVRDEASVLEQECALYRVAARAARLCGGVPTADASEGHTAFDLLHDHLTADLTRNVTLAELAELSGLGRYQVLRMFRREVGVPPHTYLLHLRIARARQLLAEGVPPAEVAAAVGFADQSHLGRHFRSITARTPAAYLRAPSRRRDRPGSAPG